MDGLDIFNVYIMGSIEMLTVFHFFTRFLKKKVKFIYYILFAFLGMTIMMFFPTGSIMELLVYVLLLMAGGFFICRTYNIFVGLYAVVMIEIMHLCYGVFNSISCILSPLFFQENPKAVSVLFMVMSSILALVTSVLCYQVINKNFSYDENVGAKYVLLILIPTLVIFLVSEYISSNIYGHTITIQADGSLPSISPFPLLFIQILGIASLFCIMFAYKKLVDSFKLSRELSLLEWTILKARALRSQLFNGINGQTQDDIEQTVWAYLQSKLDEYEIDVELVDVVVSGSRCRGLEKAGSDLDVVVEYKGREHEDDLFNVFNEDGLMIGGVKVDINPITEGKTGTLATYLPEVESYLAEKQAMQKASAVEAIPEKTITLTVAECGEFHSLGEFHENIASVEEAIAVWKSIPPERMNGIPSIGINIHTEGTERYEDVEMDILSGKVIDLEVLDYVPDITDEPKAIEVIAELIDKLPDIEVRGSLEKWQAAILASQIDQFSYDYDTYQYQDTVEDREAQVANITEDIRNGNTGYLNDFLNAVISEGVREGITDIFGEGVEIDDSEAVQTARRAKELLDKLAEYKPLAKVEELEEQNYNMIDNVLNNGAEKKEQEQIKGRISIKEKLAEKKAVIEQRDKAERTSPEKETEKKSQREM